MNKLKTTEMDIEQITQEDQTIKTWDEVAKDINSTMYIVEQAATAVSSINTQLPKCERLTWPVEEVRYLGKLIKYDEYYQYWYIEEQHLAPNLCGGFLDFKNVKDAILREYKPRKTMKWLQDKTSSVWNYNNFNGVMWTTSSQLNAQINYDVKEQVVYIEKLDAMEGHCTTMKLREFVEKMAAGELI